VIAGDIYKWTDEEGKIHYGKKPTTGSFIEEIKIKDKPDYDEELKQQNEEQKKILDVFEEERKERKEQIEEKKQIRRERKERCEDLRFFINDYFPARRVTAHSPHGAQHRQGTFCAQIALAPVRCVILFAIVLFRGTEDMSHF